MHRLHICCAMRANGRFAIHGNAEFFRCGMRKSNGVICGTFRTWFSANYPLTAFRIPQSAFCKNPRSQETSRNSAQHGRHNYRVTLMISLFVQGQKVHKMYTADSRSRRQVYTSTKSTVNSSQRRETRPSTRHTILRCEELTVWRVDWFPRHHRTTLSGHIFATEACIDNRKKTCYAAIPPLHVLIIWWTSAY